MQATTQRLSVVSPTPPARRRPTRVIHLTPRNMSKLVTSIIGFAIASAALPLTMMITNPMIRRIAMSGPGEPDLSFPRMILKCGLTLALSGYFCGMIFAFLYARSLPDDRLRALSAFITALLLAGIPAALVFSGGPANAPGDGGLNFLPHLILIAAGIVAAPFLIWSLVSIWPDRRDPYP